jgi:drug/metabolite transporter (DMT)-like permease
MPGSRREMPVAVISCLAAVLCFGSIPVVLRHLATYADAWTVNAVRYSTAALFWLPFVVVLDRRFRRCRPASTRRSIWAAALVPTAWNVLGQTGFATCPYYVDATTIGFVIRVSFLFTVLLGLLLVPAERGLVRKPAFLVGAGVSLAGVFLMYAERLVGGGGASTTGLVLVMGTAFCWAGYAVSVRRFLAGYPLRLAFGVISLYTSASLIGLMLLFGRYQQLGSLFEREWLLVIGSAFVGIAFGHVLYYRGIHGIGPVVASGMTLIGPFWTYLLAAAFLGETMTGLQVLGGLAVVAGGLALVRARAQLEPAGVPEAP